MNYIATILTAMVSGLVGVLIGTWLDRINDKKRQKMDVLKTLVTYYYAPANMERVKALNIIPILFFKDKPVCDALERYKFCQDEVTASIGNKAIFPRKYNDLIDANTKLIEIIAERMGLKSAISWDKLKTPYIPKTYIDDEGNTIFY